MEIALNLINVETIYTYSVIARYMKYAIFRQILNNTYWCIWQREQKLWGVWPPYRMTSSNGNIFRHTGHCAGNSPVTCEFPAHKGKWRGTLMFSLICAWTNSWLNNREAGDLTRHRAHYDVTLIVYSVPSICYKEAHEELTTGLITAETKHEFSNIYSHMNQALASVNMLWQRQVISNLVRSSMARGDVI